MTEKGKVDWNARVATTETGMAQLGWGDQQMPTGH